MVNTLGLVCLFLPKGRKKGLRRLKRKRPPKVFTM
jgi:hypothetical protein